MTKHTQSQASDPDTYDARADGSISNTWAHSASSRITLKVSPPFIGLRWPDPYIPFRKVAFGGKRTLWSVQWFGLTMTPQTWSTQPISQMVSKDHETSIALRAPP